MLTAPSRTRTKRSRRSTKARCKKRWAFEPMEERMLLAVLFADSFEQGEWDGQWVEDAQNDWQRSSSRASDGSYSAEVDGRATDATLTMANPLDLNTYTSAELTFSWFIESSWDSGEYLALDLYDGSSWTEVATLRGNVDQENVWHSETVTLGANYLVDGFNLRFRANVSNSSEDGYVDNVQIVGTPTEPVKVFLLVGSSLMEGLGANVDDLPSPFDVPQSDVWIWQDDLGANVGWTPLRGGFSGITNWGSGGDGSDFGPEITFGRALADAMPDTHFAFIKHAQAGITATMEDGWSPDRGGGAGPGEHWTNFITKTQDALAALDASQISYEVAGLISAQGNKDVQNPTGVEAANFEQNFTEFISAVRQEFGQPQMPVVFNQVTSAWQTGQHHDGWLTVLAAQEAIAAADPLATLIESDDLPLWDGGHFTSEGQLTFGDRFASAYLGEPFEGSASAGTHGFEAGDFSGGYEQWSTGAWTVGGDASVTATTDPLFGSYNAQLQGGSADLVRSADVTGLTNVKLRFWSRLDSFEASDTAQVKVSGDGVNWTTLLEFVDGQDDNQYNPYELDVPDLGSTIHVRFDAEMDGLDDYWYVDVVKLVGTTPAEVTPNLAPTITSSPVTAGTQDLPYSYDVDATDPDAGDTLTYSLDVFPAGMTINSGTGVIDWMPGSGQVGLNSVTVRAQDQLGAFDTQSFSIDVANVNYPPTISYPDFSDSTGLALIGQSSISSNRLSLSINGDRWGGAWADTQQFVSTAFETRFDFQLDPSNNGFAFVIQNHQPVMLGGALGYHEIPNSVVIEFDANQNGPDPNDNHVSVQSLGEERNSSDHSASQGWASPAGDLNDGQVHSATIRYVPGTLQVFVDDDSAPLLQVALDLQDVLNLDLGRAWVGFTTGGNQADVLNWTFTPDVDLSTTVGIGDLQVVEGDSGGLQATATVTRFGPGEFTLNWSTLDGTASATSDYLSDSGTLSFAAADPDEKTISVTVLGDTLEEAHENFSINLSLASGTATFVDGAGLFTILNDETSITINDAIVNEGDGSIKFTDVLVPRTIEGLNEARGMEIGPDGNIYVTSERGPWTGAVLRYDVETGSLIDVFAAHSALDGAKDLEFGPDGNLYVTNNSTNTVIRFDGSTGAFLDVFVTPNSGGLTVPRGLAFGSDTTGDGTPELYVASANSNEILGYDGATGDFLSAFVTAGSGGMLQPTAMVFGPDGNLYVAIGAHAQTNNAILRFDGTNGAFIDEFIPSGTAGLQLAPTGGLLFGSDLTGDSVADLLISNGGPNEVLAFDGVTGAFLQVYVSGGDGGLNDPKGLAHDSSGNLLVVSNGTDEILRFGVASQAAFTVSLSAASGVPVSVDFNTGDGTAMVGDGDYAATSGTLLFSPGVTQRTILVPTLDDALAESDETFVVNLSNPSAGATIADGLGQATIADNESPAGVTVSGITPNTMAPDSSGQVTISGSGFAAGAGVTFTGGSGPAPSASNIVVAPDGNSITATVSTHKKAKESAWNVVVTNPDSSSGSCAGCFSVTNSAGASATSAAMESAAANFDAGTSGDTSADDTDLMSVAAPLPSTTTSSTSTTATEPASTTTEEADAVDEAIADFDAGALEDALLEDLAVALVG